MKASRHFVKLISATAVSLVLTFPVQAEQVEPTSNEIIRALLPLDMEGRQKRGARSMDGLFNNGGSSSRGVRVVGGEEVPYIDLRVAFEFDSATLSNDAQIVLRRLANAIASPELSGSSFRLVGHTDARGTYEYNDELSRRRSEAVVAWLISNGISHDRLEVSSMGKRALLPGLPPEDERHRRVEVQNIERVARN